MTSRVLNQTHESANAGEFATPDEAYRAAVSAGLEIAMQEIRNGTTSAIVQVAVDLTERRAAVQGAVAVSTARFVDPVSVSKLPPGAFG